MKDSFQESLVLLWIHARAAGGSVVLRVDDLDGPRVKRGRDADATFDLRWLRRSVELSESMIRRFAATSSAPRRWRVMWRTVSSTRIPIAFSG